MVLGVPKGKEQLGGNTTKDKSAFKSGGEFKKKSLWH